MKEFVKNTKETIINLLPSFLQQLTPQELLYRCLNFFLFGWILSFYIYIPFLVYMSNNGFFSYDLFNNGLFAINIFSLFIAIILIGFSLMISGSFGLMLFYKKNNHVKVLKAIKYGKIFKLRNDEQRFKEMKRKKVFKAINRRVVFNILKGLRLFNIFIIITIILFVYVKSDLSMKTVEMFLWFLFLFGTSFIISIHMGILFFDRVILQFFSLIVIFIIVLPIFFFNTFPSQASKLTSIAFKVFNVGGNVNIIVKNKINKEIVYSGELIFLSPENIFIKENDNKIILERKDLEIIFPLKNKNKS